MEIKRFLLSGGVVASVDMKNLKVVALNKGSVDLLVAAKNMKVENATVVAEETIVVPEVSASSMDEQVNASIDDALGAVPTIETPEANFFDSPVVSETPVLDSVTEEPSLYSLNSQPVIEETQDVVADPVVETNKTTEVLLAEKLAEVTALVQELEKEYKEKLNLAYMQLATEKQRADKAEDDLRVFAGGVENIVSSGMGM